jgi:hypothetical protein
VFGDDRFVTVANAEVLVREFVEQAGLGKDSFVAKPRAQLAVSSAVRLACTTARPVTTDFDLHVNPTRG